MFRSLNKIMGYRLLARDGDIGKCKDFLFDDHRWAVRYMVADTGTWLSDRKVLISPISLGEPDWVSRRFPVDLTREQIESSPPLREAEPVSRQYEEQLFNYHHWPYYWAADSLWAFSDFPGTYPGEGPEKPDLTRTHPPDAGLRSADEVEGYSVSATDGDIGHVDDFIVDDASWAIRYIVVRLGSRLSGRKVLLSPDWIRSVDWPGKKVVVDVIRERVKNAPEYDPSEPVNREHEVVLYDYYGRPHYWEQVGQ
jgi:hypothetical protein